MVKSIPKSHLNWCVVDMESPTADGIILGMKQSKLKIIKQQRKRNAQYPGNWFIWSIELQIWDFMSQTQSSSVGIEKQDNSDFSQQIKKNKPAGHISF